MRTPFVLTTDTRSRHAHARHFAQGGSLPHYVQGGTGFFNNFWGGIKAALPIASQAIPTALLTHGPMKQRLKAAAQSAVTKKNLINLGRAAARPII